MLEHVPTAKPLHTLAGHALGQQFSNSYPQNRDNFFLEPRIFPQPQIVAWGRMGKRQNARPVFFPIFHRLGEVKLFLRRNVPGKGILAHYHRQLNVRQKAQKLLAPMFGAFRPWRQVARFAGARIAKPHGEKGNSCRVIENGAVNAHPASQPVTAGIIERNAGFMHPFSRRLPNDQNAGRWAELKHRARPQGQMGPANIARPYGRDCCFKIIRHNLKITHQARLQLKPINSRIDRRDVTAFIFSSNCFTANPTPGGNFCNDTSAPLRKRTPSL